MNALNTATPGPWRVSGQSDAGRYIKVTDCNGRTVARVPFTSERAIAAGEPITDANNAALIAAAPSMRDVLFILTRGEGDALQRALDLAHAIEREFGIVRGAL